MADEQLVAPMPFTASEAEIVKQTLEGLRADIASMRQGPNGWKGYAAEWVKPPVIIALIVTFVSVSGTVLYFRDTLRTAAEDNDRQDRSIENVSATLAPIPRLLERLTDRMDSTDSRQKEELLSWREWRKGVDDAVQASRDLALGQQANKTQIDGVDTRVSRVVEMFQQSNRETNSKLERILIEQAEVKARLEARLGARGEPPFGQNQIWPYPIPAQPFSVRAGIGCPDWSPVVAVRMG